MNIILLLLSAIITLLLTRSVSAFLSTTSHPNYPHHYTQQHHQLYSAAAAAMWDPKSQTYTDGIIPSHHTALDIDELLLINNGKLKIFGYGSLCWHPGYDGVLSLAGNIQLDDENIVVTEDTNKQKKQQQEEQRKVTTAPGRAIGYQRCWSQRSADHRGTTSFNGIVCRGSSPIFGNFLNRC